jgi:hypothetical protein
LLNMSISGAQLAPPPKGTSKGEFFHREENPFHDLDKRQQPTIIEAKEEVETNVRVIQIPQANERMCNSEL